MRVSTILALSFFPFYFYFFRSIIRAYIVLYPTITIAIVVIKDDDDALIPM